MRNFRVVWHRIDAPGRDACHVQLDFRGVRLEGYSVFVDDGRSFRLRYSVATDARLRTLRAMVVGHADTQGMKADIRRGTDGRWTLDGIEQPRVAGCVDVDLAFTPATNLLPLRRLGLAIGQAAPAPAAYLDLAAAQLTLLPQTYRRLSLLRYRYEAPSFGYADTLRVSRLGVVLHYPGLFEAERIAACGARRHGSRVAKDDYSPSQ